MKTHYYTIVGVIILGLGVLIAANVPSGSPIEPVYPMVTPIATTSAPYEDAIITIERTACFGMCPAYAVTVYGNGDVMYEGYSFVKTKGIKKFRIPRPKVTLLVDSFFEIDYFSLNDRYDAPVTDLPTTTTSITVNGQKKQVINYFGAPAALNQLEDSIDRAVGIKELVGTCTSMEPESCK